MPRVARFFGKPQSIATVRPKANDNWAFAAAAAAPVISFGLRPQEASQWCWCAIAQGLVYKYRAANPAQQDVATDHIRHTPGRGGQSCAGAQGQPAGRGDCAAHACTVPCNGDHQIDVVLNELGFATQPDYPLFDELTMQLKLHAGPIVVRINYIGVGHYVIVTGWVPGQGYVVHDPRGQLIPNSPWINPRYATYDQLLHHYPPDPGGYGGALGCWSVTP